jgi:hypothetical protein
MLEHRIMFHGDFQISTIFDGSKFYMTILETYPEYGLYIENITLLLKNNILDKLECYLNSLDSKEKESLKKEIEKILNYKIIGSRDVVSLFTLLFIANSKGWFEESWKLLQEEREKEKISSGQ